MDKNYLLTYSYENNEGMSDTDYAWYSSEEEMYEGIEFKKEIFHCFEVIDAIEIINARDIKI